MTCAVSDILGHVLCIVLLDTAIPDLELNFYAENGSARGEVSVGGSSVSIPTPPCYHPPSQTLRGL
jgi:hypothetical protein